MEPTVKTFILFVVASMICSVVPSVTVEEGRAATLQCPGFTPTPGGDEDAIFTWYKANLNDAFNDTRVASHDKWDDPLHQYSYKDLAGRATIDRTTGALEITQTRVTDDHVYSCIFNFTSTGWLWNETQLTVTVTPSEQDLQTMAEVLSKTSMTFKCSASRVRPLPREMYWQFIDEPRHLGDYKSVTNSDGLTASVSVQYSLTINHTHVGRKLACYYVTSTIVIISHKLTIHIKSEPIGTPLLETNSKTVKTNLKIDFECDSSQLNGTATWFVWKFANGTKLGNTTKPTWTYDAKEKPETLQFVCIAGNWWGQSNKSQIVSIEVQRLAEPIGTPLLETNSKTVKTNSKIDFECDSSQLNGTATWFVWKFANGTKLGNTTKPTWTYDAKEKPETLQFVCIAGNWWGQSNNSQIVSIEVQRLGTTKLVVISCAVTGGGLALTFKIIGIVCFVRHRKLSDTRVQLTLE